MTVSPERDRARVLERGDWKNIRQGLYYWNSRNSSHYPGAKPTTLLKQRKGVFSQEKERKGGGIAMPKQLQVSGYPFRDGGPWI